MEKLTICPYCGCGCRLNLIYDGKIARVFPDETDKVSRGKPCLKGLSLDQVLEEGRILKPMIRNQKESALRETSWQEALLFVHKKIEGLKPDDVFLVTSGKTTNEDCVVEEEFAQRVLKTGQVDCCCARVCHSITTQATKRFFGSEFINSKMEEISSLDCLLIIGSNPASNYPALFNLILQAQTKGMKVISVQPMENLTSRRANLALFVENGKESRLLAIIINELIKRKAYPPEVEKIEGFEILKESVKSYSFGRLKRTLKLSKRKFEKLISFLSQSRSFGIIHGMGLTQEMNGRESIYLLFNLLVLKRGKLFSLRGQVNVQGANDIRNAYSRGKTKSLVEALLISPVKAIFLVGFNPAQSLPNLDLVRKNLKEMFVIQMDSYFNSTSQFADVILPIPTLLESNGTITTGERRLRLVRQILKPLGQSRSPWLIFKKLAQLFGKGEEFNYLNEKEIFEKLVAGKVSAYKNVDPNLIWRGDDAFAERVAKFTKFLPVQLKPLGKITSSKYPLVLTTFRASQQFLTGEMTLKSKRLTSGLEPCCYISEKDAKELKIKDGDRIEVASRVACVITQAKIDKRMPKGLVGMHFHFPDLPVNRLFPSEFDNETLTPNYKSVAVFIRKINVSAQSRDFLFLLQRKFQQLPPWQN